MTYLLPISLIVWLGKARAPLTTPGPVRRKPTKEPVIAGAGDTPEYGETRPVRRFPLLPYGGTSAYWTAALDCARVRPMP